MMMRRIEYKVDNYWAKMFALKRVESVDIRNLRMVIYEPHMIEILPEADLKFLKKALGEDQEMLDYFLFESKAVNENG